MNYGTTDYTYNRIIEFLDIIHCPVFYSKHNVLKGGLTSSESTALVSGPLNMSIQMAKTTYHNLLMKCKVKDNVPTVLIHT